MGNTADISHGKILTGSLCIAHAKEMVFVNKKKHFFQSV